VRMENLGSFFSALNIWNVGYGVLLLAVLDVVGFAIDKLFIQSQKHFRGSLWMIGLGVYTFLWFVANLAVPLSRTNVSIFTFILFALCFPLYVKRKGMKSLFDFLPNLIVPILIITPLAFFVFVKASLPPYLTDEMAYHYIPPMVLMSQPKWEFSSGIYHVIPKNLETFWDTTFAVTKTYSLARLFHFFIFFGCMCTIFSWIKSRQNLLTAVLFMIMIFYLPQDMIIQSTSGYIDVGSASLALVAIVGLIDYILTKSTSSLLFSSVFWGLGLGSKYTVISAAVSWGFLVVISWIAPILMKRKFDITLNKKIIKIAFSAILLFVATGGFWYVKNLALTGNPIYPFLFKCKPQDCMNNKQYFSGWTKQINLENSRSIATDIFAGNSKLATVFVISLAISLISFFEKSSSITFLLITSVFIEFLVINKFSGFLFRYFLHFQYIAMLIISLQCFVAKKTPKIIKGLKYIFSIFIAILSVSFIKNSLRLLYSNSYLPAHEISYANNVFSIYGWVDLAFPRVKEVIKWCDSPNADGTDKTITTYDPDLIWFTYDGQMRVFMTHCRYGNFLGTGMPVGEVPSYLRKNNYKFYLASINPCLPSGKLKKYDYETEQQVNMRELNNVIVCNSKEIAPSLYYFQ